LERYILKYIKCDRCGKMLFKDEQFEKKEIHGKILTFCDKRCLQEYMSMARNERGILD